MTLRELAAALDAELVGAAGEEEVLGASGLDDIAPGHIVYAEGESRLAAAEASPSLAIIVSADVKGSRRKPLLRVANPRLAFARALRLLHPTPRMPAGIASSAHIGSAAALAQDVAVGAYSFIGDGAKIGDGAQIHPLAVVGSNVEIGEESVIFPHVVLCDGVQIGARVILHAGTVVGSVGFGFEWDGERHVRMPHVGTVIVEDDVEVGANCTIDRGTTGATIIGRGTKIDNLVHVAHNVRIGENCLLAGQVGISGSVRLGDRVTLAGQAGVSDHIEMGDGSVGAAGADVIRNVPPNTVVLGRPARPIGQQMRIDAAAARLPDLLREVRELRKRMAELERSSS